MKNADQVAGLPDKATDKPSIVVVNENQVCSGDVDG